MQRFRNSFTPPRPLLVLAFSGALGFWIGITAFPDWQVAVETAQVVAGLVQYPTDNPFYIYHVKLWTVLHQLGAVLLRSGVSELGLSKIVSGLLGLISLQALTMFVYAFSRDGLYAIGSAFAIVFSGAADFGVAYPIMFVGTSHTYGVIGLSTLVLAAGLIGSGRYHLGGFLVGVMPAVHPSLGAWLAVIMAISLASDFKKLSVELRPALPWFLAGSALTLISLVVHLIFAAGVPRVEKEVVEPYLLMFVRFWDGHRQAVDVGRPGVLLNFGALALALMWLRFFADDLPRPALLLLRFVVVSASVGIACVFLSRIPPDELPALLTILMPLRVLNIAAMTSAALLFGLIGAYRQTAWGQLIALLLLAGLLLGNRSLLWTVLQPEGRTASSTGLDSLRALEIAAFGFVVCVGLYRLMQPGAPPQSRTVAAMKAVRVVSLGALVLYTVPALQARALVLYDRTNAPWFAGLAAGEGLLLTGSDLHLIQLRTRRPVLLDGGGLDGLTYALEAGPGMNRIMRDVYGVDLFNPPEEARGGGVIPRHTNRHAWEGYTRKKWQEIRRAYNVTQVLTEAEWMLDLPLVGRDHGMALYEIPER